MSGRISTGLRAEPRLGMPDMESAEGGSSGWRTEKLGSGKTRNQRLVEALKIQVLMDHSGADPQQTADKTA